MPPGVYIRDRAWVPLPYLKDAKLTLILTASSARIRTGTWIVISDGRSRLLKNAALETATIWDVEIAMTATRTRFAYSTVMAPGSSISPTMPTLHGLPSQEIWSLHSSVRSTWRRAATGSFWQRRLQRVMQGFITLLCLFFVHSEVVTGSSLESRTGMYIVTLTLEDRRLYGCLLMPQRWFLGMDWYTGRNIL